MIIGDVGSCHMGSLERAKEHIRIGKECGLDAVKFQLLEDEQCQDGNIKLPWHFFDHLVDYGWELNIPVFASAFSNESYDFLSLTMDECDEYDKWVKYAFSQRYRLDLNWEKVFCSWGFLDTPPKADNLVNLFCIPEYPVLYEIPLWTFVHIFKRFDGFSSHCLGINQEVKAIQAGAKYLEVHFGLPGSDCPDGKFAKTPAEIEKLASYQIECQS